MVKKIMVASLFASASHLAFASSAVAGAGAGQKCGDWTAARAQPSKSVQDSVIVNMTSSWIQGYLSGVNAAEVLEKKRWAFDIPSPAVLDALLDKICKEDPLKEIFSAAVQMSVLLRQRSPMPAN